jgi:hypothetical protein
MVPDKISQLEERDLECEALYGSPEMSCARSVSYLGLPVRGGDISGDSGTVELAEIGIVCKSGRAGGYTIPSGELDAN